MFRFVVVALFGAGGFLLARWWGVPDAAALPTVEAAAATAAPEQRVLLEPKGPGCPDLAFVDTLLLRAREEIEGVPMPFPPNLAPGVSPDEFRKAIDALKAECPGLSVGRVDCDEYPCVAWTRGPACPAADRFQHDQSYDIALVERDGAYVEWGGVYAVQPEAFPKMTGTEIDNFRARVVTRRLAAEEAFLSESGGRTPTKLEEAVRERNEAADKLDAAVGAEAIERAKRGLDHAERQVTNAEKIQEAP